MKLCTFFDTKDSFLVAEIKEARCLQKAVAGYVKCYLLPDKKKTKQKTIVVKDKTTMPEFDEVLRWEVPDPRVSGTDNGMLPKGGGWGVQFETKGGGARLMMGTASCHTQTHRHTHIPHRA